MSEIYTVEGVSNPNIYTQQGVTNWTQDSLKQYFADMNREINLSELRDMLSLTIKHDDTNKIITFLGMLLTYTENDQFNILFNAESSSGKSYIPLGISEYFPREDVMILAYSSPTAFYHETGEWDEDEQIKRIDLSRKIMIFLDMPHDQLLQRLRPLLSHDRKELLVKITDRSKSKGLATKQALLIGYPTVIFCSTNYSLDSQELTRCIMLSPEIDESKINEALKLIAERDSDREAFKKKIENDPKYNFLKARVESIKSANIREIIIPEDLRDELLILFKASQKNVIPRHMRDFPRLFSLVKSCALLNLHNRERINSNLVAIREDIDQALELYLNVSKPNEMGIPPEAYDFYTKIFLTESENTDYANFKELAAGYYKTYHKPIGRKRLLKIIEMLLEAGLIIEGKDPVDARITAYSNPEGLIQTELS